jgi:hypothetical protein
VRTISDEATVLGEPRAFDTIIYGGLVVGVLDASDAMIFFGLRGGSPRGIFQYIASGLLGRASFSGGSKTVLLGVLLHFLIAFIHAAIYYSLSLRFPMLIRQAVIWGMIYGVAAYFVMSRIVVPLSAAPKIPFRFVPFVNGVLAITLLVGLPIALIARWSAKANKKPSKHGCLRASQDAR